MWAAGCIVLAPPLPMVATRTALVAHTPRFFFVAAGKSGGCSFCAQRWPQALLPRATSSLILIRSHKRADALEQEVLWVSTSGAGFDVGGPASAVQVRDGVLSPG